MTIGSTPRAISWRILACLLALSACGSSGSTQTTPFNAATSGVPASPSSVQAGSQIVPAPASGGAGAASQATAASTTPPRTSAGAGGGAASAVSTAAIGGSVASSGQISAGMGGVVAMASAGAGAGSGGSSGAAGAGPSMVAAGWPSVMDLKATGPFTPQRGEGPSGYVVFHPKELGKDGVKHPVVSWGPGAAENASSFLMLLNHLASHGFAVISYDATPQGQELTKGIDWMLMENARAQSPFYQKLDETKIAAGGHSAGSLATFVIGADKRLTTTMHISGGTFDPHTDIKNLHAPALFICGETDGDGLLVGDVARPNCDIDFMNATVPVFYGVTKGASHMTPTDIGDSAIRAHQFGAMVAWLRWQLAADTATKALFAGSTCGLCMDAAWSVAKQKSL